MLIPTTLDVDVSDGKAVDDEQQQLPEPEKDEKTVSIPKQPSATAGMWLLTPMWGQSRGNASDFSDMAFYDGGFPLLTTLFKAIKSIKLCSDGDTEYPMFTNYTITFLPEGKVSNPKQAGYVLGVEQKELVLSDLESVKSISLGRRRPPGGGRIYETYISFISVATENNTISVGKSAESQMFYFTVPTGWRFAGFYGRITGTSPLFEKYTNRNRYGINSLGFILASLD